MQGCKRWMYKRAVTGVEHLRGAHIRIPAKDWTDLAPSSSVLLSLDMCEPLQHASRSPASAVLQSAWRKSQPSI
eukprot:20534-Heterococcus_DN1.PRE.1